MHALLIADSPIALGRGTNAHFRLDDPTVSRAHVELHHSAGRWLAIDLSREQTPTLDGYPVGRYTPIERESILVLGQDTTVRLCDAGVDSVRTIRGEAPQATLDGLALRYVELLDLFCRPLPPDRSGSLENKELAEALFISVSDVKKRLNVLYLHFGLREMRQGEKRLRLIEVGRRLGMGHVPANSHG